MVNVRPRKTRVSCAVFFPIAFSWPYCTKHLRGGLPRANYCWITHGRSWQTQMLIAHYVPIILVAPAHQRNPWNNKLLWNMVSPPLPIETRCVKQMRLHEYLYGIAVKQTWKDHLQKSTMNPTDDFQLKKCPRLNKFQHKIKTKEIQHNSIDGGFLGYHPRSDSEIIHHTCTWIHQ